MPKIAIITYPRSGQNFLEYCLKETTDIEVICTHPNLTDDHTTKDLTEGYTKLTIVRNPVDAIASISTLEIVGNGINFVDSTFIANRLKNYILANEYIMDNADIFIGYDELSDPETLVRSLCERVGGQVTGSFDNINQRYEQYHLENKPEWKLLSSQDQYLYNSVRNAVSSWTAYGEYTLARCNEIYNIALSKI